MFNGGCNGDAQATCGVGSTGTTAGIADATSFTGCTASTCDGSAITNANAARTAGTATGGTEAASKSEAAGSTIIFTCEHITGVGVAAATNTYTCGALGTFTNAGTVVTCPTGTVVTCPTAGPTCDGSAITNANAARTGGDATGGTGAAGATEAAGTTMIFTCTHTAPAANTYTCGALGTFTNAGTVVTCPADPATCSTIATTADFCTTTGETYNAANFASTCASAVTCTKATAADQTACCIAAAKQIKVGVTVTLTGVTEEQVTPVFKIALKSTYAAKAGVDPSQVTLTFVYTKAATRRLAAGDTVAVTATIAVADAAAATKVSADVVKLEPTAFIATLKKELKKEKVELGAVTATVAAPTTTGTSSDSSANVESEDSGFESAGSAGHCSTLAMLIVLAAMWAGN